MIGMEEIEEVLGVVVEKVVGGDGSGSGGGSK